MDFLKSGILPLALAIVSWIIKDLLVKSAIKRAEAARAEWEYRLKEVWSPLFFWSGILFFSDSSLGWQKHGVKELESILAKTAHLLPLKHYFTLIRMIEGATNQKTTPVDVEQVKHTRDYVYRQIELLNYLLYRHKATYEADFAVDITAPYRFLLRAASGFSIHLLLWAAVAGIIMGLYLCYTAKNWWPFAVLILIFLAVMAIDARSRYQVYKQVKARLEE